MCCNHRRQCTNKEALLWRHDRHRWHHAVYHLSCLVKLYRQAASIECAENDENDQSRFLKAQAFADLIDYMYIESQRGTGSVFRTAEVVNLYSLRLLSIGVNKYVHTTRLRQKVIAAVPDLVEVKCPSNRTELAFDDDISPALQELADSCDTEAMALVKARYCDSICSQ